MNTKFVETVLPYNLSYQRTFLLRYAACWSFSILKNLFNKMVTKNGIVKDYSTIVCKTTVKLSAII